VPQLKYCRSYSRECGKRSGGNGDARGVDEGGETSRRPVAVPGGERRTGKAVKAGLILNMMISRIRRRSGLPLPPSYSPPNDTYDMSSFSLSLSLSLSLFLFSSFFPFFLIAVRAFETHTRAHTMSTSAWLSARRSYPPYVASAHVPPSPLPHCARDVVDVCASFLCLSYIPVLSSPLVSPSKGRTGGRDVTCSFTLSVIFFPLCGALNRLLVRARVYTRRVLERSVVPHYRGMFRYVYREGIPPAN